MIQEIIGGFAILLNIWTLIAALTGLASGIVVGSLPGLTATMGVAILVPFTFFIPPEIGIPFLLAVYKGAIYGGSITAIVIATPGTAAAAATVLDGHALTKQGKSKLALDVALYAAVFGDLFSTLVLIFAASAIAGVALKFSSPDFTMLLIFSLTMIAAVSGDSLIKGIISALIGIMFGCVGLDVISGMNRYTFGSVDLQAGISLVPLLIGMFALSEVIIQFEKNIVLAKSKIDRNELSISMKDMLKHWRTLLRSSSIGTFIGALPGLGAEISCWISYGLARRFSKKPEKFGKGSIEGVAAAEAASNAVCPSALIPMLAFGIPGDTVTAVLLGAFMAHNLNPGPVLFVQHREILYGFFAVLIVTNIMLLAFGKIAIRYLRNIASIPNSILMPIVIALCFAGAFAINSSAFDMMIALLGGILGYLMRKMDVPVPPLVIALLLTPMLEQSLRQSLLFSDGSFLIFVSRPISAGFLIITVLSVVGIIFQTIRSTKRTAL